MLLSTNTFTTLYVCCYLHLYTRTVFALMLSTGFSTFNAEATASWKSLAPFYQTAERHLADGNIFIHTVAKARNFDYQVRE
jgi:hypothetical protein